MRKEKDLIGEKEIPSDVLWGVHSLRASENFKIAGRGVNPALLHAFGEVKLACAVTNHELGKWDEPTFIAISTACRELIEGRLDGHFIVDALQGGAGTSTNMNVNEVIANRALQMLGLAPGSYEKISPIEDINLHQSTNDCYPTALRIAAIRSIKKLEGALVALLDSFQRKEKEFSKIVKVARTEMQDAVLCTLGRSFSAFAEAIGRDRWRIFKCEERLRVVNLGGTAIGTGIAAPRKYIFRVVENLKKASGLGLARAENLVEATQNADAFVEVSGILSACASNLLKISGDLRLMSSGPDAGFGEIVLPSVQAGSSIMPGKVNPVVPEAVSQAAIMVLSNHSAIGMAASMGSLELNPFLPLVADCLLGSIGSLTAACATLKDNCADGITANEKKCAFSVSNSTASLTALIGKIGYNEAQKLAGIAKEGGKTIRDAAISSGMLSSEEFDELVSPEAVNRLGS